MREMKDSGIEWVGAIPNHWRVSKIKQIVRWKSVKGQPDLPVLSLYRDYGVIPKDSRDDNHNVTSLDTSGYKVVEHGDLVINKMKAWQGSLAVSEYNGIVSPAYHICKITSENICKKYLHYLLRDASYLPEYMRLSTGLRVGQWDLSFDDFKNIPFLVPPLAEQERIAAFLDAECAEIDAVLEKTRASIEEYKKLKQAVITQAVTKGIRSDRPMKDSGIEWIGEIPAEWEIRKIFRAINKVGDIDHYMPDSVDDGIPYLMTGDLQEKLSDVNLKRCKKVSFQDYEMLSSKIRVSKGDVIFARYATIGTVCFVDTEDNILVSYACLIIKPNSSLLYGEFLFYYLKSTAFLEEIKQYIKANTQANVGLDSVSKAKIALPSVHEQQKIVEYLRDKCKKIDALIAKKQQYLTEIENYKKSLIYEYVTGKKEVHPL